MRSIRRRLPLVLAGACLVLTAAAAAAPSSFTVAWSPSHVKPETSATYTVSLTNSASSDPKGADRATISADGFQVTGVPTASVTQSGPCATAPPWTTEVAADGHTITARRTSGPNTNNVCPGGTLKVVFTATSPAGPDGPYQWPTSMLRGDEAFTGGPSPTVTVDGVPPQTSITQDPPSLTNSASASFAFSSENGATFECRLDGGAFSACASPKNYSGLPEGTRTFQVRAVDQAGNADPTPATRTWTIDLTPPATTIDTGPPPLTNSTSASFTFSSEAGATFQCRRDGSAFAACDSPKNYSALPEGARTFDVRAIDEAGNVDPSFARRSWTIDVTPPQTTISSGPPSPTNSTSASFTFSSEPGATFECRRDGGAFASCTSPKSYAALPEGTRTFDVRAIDEAGNVDASFATRTWTIDLTPPQTTITSGPSGTTNATGATFNFSSDEGGSTFECSLDGGAFASCTSPKSYSGLPGGARSFAVRATDPAGNTGTSATRSWAIDLNGPATSISSAPPGATNSRSASFAFSSEAGATFECSLDGALFSQCQSPMHYGDLSDGGHAFAVRAVDPASNTGPPSVRNWTIDTRAPAVAVSSGPAALSNRRSAAFAFSADEGASFVCALDSGEPRPCTSPTSYDGLGDGAHSFSVNASDAVGNIGGASYVWVIDATAPETALASAPRSGTAATSATFTFQANEPVSFECQLDGEAFAPCNSPKGYGRLSKTRHTFAVRAIDAAGNIDATPATHSWTIAAAPRTVKKATTLFAPENGARVRTPPRLAWRPVAGASYYNVQLFRGRVKVLSAWPRRTRLQLRARWKFLGRQRTLSPGRYRWYVWPAFRSNSYGKLLGQSTFVVTRR